MPFSMRLLRERHALLVKCLVCHCFSCAVQVVVPATCHRIRGRGCASHSLVYATSCHALFDTAISYMCSLLLSTPSPPSSSSLTHSYLFLSVVISKLQQSFSALVRTCGARAGPLREKNDMEKSENTARSFTTTQHHGSHQLCFS